MNKRQFEKILFRLEFEMRKAETQGDALMVTYYQDLIEDFLDMTENGPPLLNVNPSPPLTNDE